MFALSSFSSATLNFQKKKNSYLSESFYSSEGILYILGNFDGFFGLFHHKNNIILYSNTVEKKMSIILAAIIDSRKNNFALIRFELILLPSFFFSFLGFFFIGIFCLQY